MAACDKMTTRLMWGVAAIGVCMGMMGAATKYIALPDLVDKGAKISPAGMALKEKTADDFMQVGVLLTLIGVGVNGLRRPRHPTGAERAKKYTDEATHG